MVSKGMEGQPRFGGIGAVSGIAQGFRKRKEAGIARQAYWARRKKSCFIAKKEGCGG